jgi:hypothetical protein
MTDEGKLPNYFAYHGEGDDPSLPPFKEGRPAEHEIGVGYFAPWHDPFAGFHEHARRNAFALDAAGLPVHLRSIAPAVFAGKDRAFWKMEARYKHMTDASIKRYLVQLFQFVPSEEMLQSKVVHPAYNDDELRALNHYKIFYNVWERSSAPRPMVELLNRVGQIWVACQANVRMLTSCGADADKIRVVPIPFFDDDPLLKLIGRQRQPGVPRFYHIGKWEPRKCQDQIIRAFMLAFKPGEAKLMMKVIDLQEKLKGHPQSIEHAIHECNEDPEVQSNGWSIQEARKNIFIIKRMLPPEQIVRLHNVGDCYVSLSRGEGFDMPAYDSQLAGNMLIYTPSGGPQDFADPRCFEVPKTGEVPCHPFYNWGPEDTYLDFDLHVAVLAMREAAQRVRDGSWDRDGDHVGVLRKRFGAEAVGQYMRDQIEQLASSEVPEKKKKRDL